MDVSRAEWHKSTRSGSSGSCIEVAGNLPKIMVRDSKDRHGSMLSFTAGPWASFVRDVKAGRFDT
ncbi:DUF397 domain-containing protein [Micromonospora sp. NBC_01405]|uniref:DUF397 domain-containing protein n=1 Tax=Micromonospora sp. NBC_01405 TaxID=2903589 RepID=UPI0032526DAE